MIEHLCDGLSDLCLILVYLHCAYLLSIRTDDVDISIHMQVLSVTFLVNPSWFVVF